MPRPADEEYWWGNPPHPDETGDLGDDIREGAKQAKEQSMSDQEWDNYDDEFGPSHGRFGKSRRPPDKGVKIPGVEAIRETDAALLVRGPGLSSDPFGVSDPNEEGWIPKSQILKDSEVQEVGDKGTLLISTWIAEKRGLV